MNVLEFYRIRVEYREYREGYHRPLEEDIYVRDFGSFKEIKAKLKQYQATKFNSNVTVKYSMERVTVDYLYYFESKLPSECYVKVQDQGVDKVVHFIKDIKPKLDEVVKHNTTYLKEKDWKAELKMNNIVYVPNSDWWNTLTYFFKEELSSSFRNHVKYEGNSQYIDNPTMLIADLKRVVNKYDEFGKSKTRIFQIVTDTVNDCVNNPNALSRFHGFENDNQIGKELIVAFKNSNDARTYKNIKPNEKEALKLLSKEEPRYQGYEFLQRAWFDHGATYKCVPVTYRKEGTSIYKYV